MICGSRWKAVEVSSRFPRFRTSCNLFWFYFTRQILYVFTLKLYLCSRNNNNNYNFWQIWARKYKSCPFCLKMDTISQGCWFRIQTLWNFLKFPPQNPFLGKFGAKISKVSVLYENWYTWYLKDADSYSNITFLNFKS